MSMLPRTRIMVTGGMRTGTSLMASILNAHPDIIILKEFVHFFRYIFGRYERLDRNVVWRMLREMDCRLRHRYGSTIEVESILADIDAAGYSYENVYDGIMRYYLRASGKTICGEDVSLHWRSIPDFLRLFPDGKVIHVHRDPRAALVSWGKASYEKVNYLNILFNLVDSMNYGRLYRESLSSSSYLSVRYEDLCLHTKRETERICDFLGVAMDPAQLASDKWKEVFDPKFMRTGWSSWTQKAPDGISCDRLHHWEKDITDWELCLCDWLCADQMKDFGYEPSPTKLSGTTVRESLAVLQSSDFLLRNLVAWLETGTGNQNYPNDPRDPENWGAEGKNKVKFLDTAAGTAFLQEMKTIKLESSPASSKSEDL